MKWGILATGNIAKKFASTINQMGKENEQLVAVGSRHIESAKAFAIMSMISRDIMIRMKHWLKIRMLRLFMLRHQILYIMRIAGYVLSMASMYCVKSRLQ